MKNPLQGLRISLILSNIVSTKTSLIAFTLFFSLLLPVSFSFADVFIPTNEYVGYFDSNGIYTVVGNIKNKFDHAITPVVTISVKDDSEIFSKTIPYIPLAASAEIPFKIKFPEISGNAPALLSPKLLFEETKKDIIPIIVLYDQTLIKHDDGHLTGRIQNIGDKIIYNPKIFAVIHGYEQVLDVVHNMEFIEKINPGEIIEFSMYPDPSITEEISYYSCFAPVDTTVIPVTAKKNNGDYDFRYDSGAWYSAAKFDEKGTTLSIRGYNSYPLETYANFEFPQISDNEKFNVTLNDEPIEFIQSMDDMGFWHVVFSVEPTSQGIIKISGFEQGLPPELPKIPQWVKLNADWWSTNQIPDSEFLEGINFLFEKEIIYVSSRNVISESQWQIPQWVKSPAGWWFDEKISDDEFLNIVKNLVERGIIII